MGIQSPNTSLLDASKLPASNTTPAPLSGPANTAVFSEKGIQPPSRVYINRDDQVFINAMSSQAGETVIVRYRILLIDGSLSTNEQRVTLPTAYNISAGSPFFAAAEGWLLSLAVVCLLANKRGQTFVRVGLGRAGSGLTAPIETLFADYVNSNSPYGWPEGRVIDPTESTGAFRRISVSNPAAGVDWSLPQPVNTRWLIRHVTAILTTAVAAANRNARLSIQPDATGIVVLIPSPQDQAASLAFTYCTAAAAIAGSAAAAVNTWAPEATITLDNGLGAIRSSTANIQAADQWSAITVGVEEWLVGV